MANGSFRSTESTAAGSVSSGFSRHIYVTWSSTNDTSDNKSTISYSIYSGSDGSSTNTYVYLESCTVTINGTTVYKVDSSVKCYKDTKLASGTISVSHGTNGTKKVSVSINAKFYSSISTASTYSGTITMTNNPVYDLSISAGEGSSITVNRTSCNGVGSTGTLTSRSSILNYGDVIKVTFTPSENYAIDTSTLNGSSFASGGSHTVSSDVTIASTASPLKSTLMATDANVGSVSTLTVTRYNTAYTHTITYSFGSLSGTIVSDSSDTTIAWRIPTEFYGEMTEATSMNCTLTIETFKEGSSIGTTTTTILVTVPSDLASPDVTITVADTNTASIALTGDSSTLIRYISTALCTITATPKYSATVRSITINGEALSFEESSESVTVTKTYDEPDTGTYTVTVTDSRGLSNTTEVNVTVINYIKLTINPILARPTPTGNQITAEFSGNFYNGSFGSTANTLSISYRYKESGGNYPTTWQTIDSGDYVIGSNQFHTESAIQLSEYVSGTEDGFDYQKQYEFQIRATDGADGTTLSTVTQTVTVKRGIPLFDWGENDFTFHIPIILGSTELTEEKLQQLLALLGG